MARSLWELHDAMRLRLVEQDGARERPGRDARTDRQDRGRGACDTDETKRHRPDFADMPPGGPGPLFAPLDDVSNSGDAGYLASRNSNAAPLAGRTFQSSTLNSTRQSCKVSLL